MAVLEAERPEAEQAFHLEHHGIDYIPLTERWAKPRDLFGMWAGASFQIEYFVYGVTLMTFGFTFVQAVLLIVLGNLSYLLLGVASLQGPDAGTTVFAINRASYGPNGSRLIAFFNWLTQVGFETEGLILIVLAAEVLTLKAGFHAGTPAKVIFIIVGVSIQMLLPLLGHATVVKTLRLLSVPFLVLYAVLAGLTLGKANFHAVAHGASWETMMGGLAFVIVLSGLGWAECGNDYSRYLPPNASKSSIVGWVFLGTAVPEILIMLLGAAIGTYATAIATSANPFAAFSSPHVVTSGIVVPFLILAILQLFSVNSLDLYSSGVTLQALGLRVKRHHAVLIDTVISCGVTIYAVFDSNFTTYLKDFVDVVIVWIAPWLAIYLVDWALRKFRYVPRELQRTDSHGLYWSRGGVRWAAIIAQLIGMVASIEALSATFALPHWLNEITFHLGGTAPGYGADFSVFTGMAAGGLVYFVLAAGAVRKEAERQDEILASKTRSRW